MPDSKLSAFDVKLLTGLADALLWAERDRAADAIYAAIEADEAACTASTAGEWNEVFQGGQ